MQRLARDHKYAHIVLFGQVFMHVRYLVGWCESFSPSDQLIFDPYAPMYPIHLSRPSSRPRGVLPRMRYLPNR